MKSRGAVSLVGLRSWELGDDQGAGTASGLSWGARASATALGVTAGAAPQGILRAKLNQALLTEAFEGVDQESRAHSSGLRA